MAWKKNFFFEEAKYDQKPKSNSTMLSCIKLNEMGLRASQAVWPDSVSLIPPESSLTENGEVHKTQKCHKT